jgi:hypothetical protein
MLFIEHYFVHVLRNMIFWLVLRQMEKGKLDKGYSSISGPRVIEKNFSDMNITGTGFGSGSSVSTDMDSFVSKPKGGNLSLFSHLLQILVSR